MIQKYIIKRKSTTVVQRTVYNNKKMKPEAIQNRELNTNKKISSITAYLVSKAVSSLFKCL